MILWGAVVRATGSGAGCGSHWPLCNGEVIPLATAIATKIEFFHRFTSGVSLLLVGGLWIQCLRKLERGHRARFYSTLSLGFIISEALVGAGLVIFGLVAKDDSAGRAWVVAFHLINTLFLVGSLTLTSCSLSLDTDKRSRLRLDKYTLPLTALFLFLAASGAISALGDTLFPVASVREGMAQDFSATSHWLLRLRTFHPLLALIFAFTAFAYALPIQTKISKAFQHTILLQITLGVINWLTLAPIPVQIFHLLISNLVWVFWIRLIFRPA